MKRFLWILVAVLPLMQLTAMTDQQVMQSAMNLYQQGLPEQEIAKQLLRQGATIEQMQRLSKQANSAQMRGTTTPAMTTASSSDLRQNNGEFLPDVLTSMILYRDLERKPSLVFGHDIFRSPEGQFTPNMNQATPKSYTLGTGDEVIIDIYGAAQINVKQTISPDGTITINGYGPIHLSGLSIMEATKRLKNTLGTRYEGSQIMLSLGQTRSITVNVMGEVETPGSYQLSAFANVMNALYMAGGITDKGTLRAIRVFRNSKQISEVDLYSYLMDGVLDGDVRLEDGDVIIVNTYQSMTAIGGKVKRPMRYEMKQDESLDRLLYFAGGFSGEAYTDAARVMRKNNGAQSVHTIKNADFGSFRMMDGDSVNIAAILPRLKNTVMIRGAVFRGGYYGLDEHIATVRQLVAAADGLSEDASPSRAVLYRMQLDRTFLALAIDLQGILNGTAEDIELRNEDQLFVPSRRNELQHLKVVIHGEVYNPDTFAFAHNESVEDLILRAGGLTEKASLSKVDIARRIIDPKATDELKVRTQLFSVELNDSLGLNEHGFLLEPYDEVFVRRSPAFGQQMNVRIQGEVLFGGIYTMKTQDDRLSDLVLQAGGLTSHAFTKGARLQRRMTQDERLRREQLLKINAAASFKDSVNAAKLDLGDTYWVGIDLAEALQNPGCDEDITLREGDVLIIPSVNNTVKINGEVLFPNTVSFLEGKNAKYYIDQAGGFSNNAKRCKAYIIYANGKVHPVSGGKVQPGCEIVVPGKPIKEPMGVAGWVSITSASASLASVAATVTTLIVNLNKK